LMLMNLLLSSFEANFTIISCAAIPNASE